MNSYRKFRKRAQIFLDRLYYTLCVYLRDNVHSHLHHAKRPMAVGGGGGGGGGLSNMAVFREQSGTFVLKLKNCKKLNCRNKM